jgi:hypothetical protein
MAEFAISRVTLHSRLQSGRLTPGEALAIATETAECWQRRTPRGESTEISPAQAFSSKTPARRKSRYKALATKSLMMRVLTMQV